MGIAEFLDAPDSALLVAINGEVELVTTKHVTTTRLIVDRFALGSVANVDAVMALLQHARPLSTTAPESVPALPSPSADESSDLLCPDCGQCFTRKDTLVRHRKSHGRASTARVVPPVEDLTCSECSQVFETIPGLLSHRRHVHAIAPAVVGVPCHLCPRMFKNQHALDEHLTRGHQVNGTWSTKPKPKADSTPAQDDPVATEQHTYACPECGQTFAKQRAMGAHRARAHDMHRPPRREPLTGEHGCSACDARFETPVALRMHEMKVHRVPPPTAVAMVAAVAAPDESESIPAPPPVSLDVAHASESPVKPDRKKSRNPAMIADGVCPVCHEPLLTHEKCDGCGVLVGPGHETEHRVFISGADYCRDCARARIIARKAELVAA